MSRFSDAMGLTGGAALMYQASDPIEYWPDGVEEDAVDIDAIFTPANSREEKMDTGTAQVSRGELQVWANDTTGRETPNIKSDVAVIGGAQWRVVEVLETSGGLHRLVVETSARGVIGRRRGWR